MKGAVHRFRPRGAVGHEQHSARFAIVTLASRFEHLSTWLVVPTSTSAHPYAFRPEVEVLGKTTLAVCDQVVAVDPDQRLGDQIGYVSLEEMRAIDETLAILSTSTSTSTS